MKAIFAVVIITLAIVALVTAQKGGPGGPRTCDADLVNKICATDAEKRGEDMINQSNMSADCKTKVINAMKALTPEKVQICAGKSDATKTCEGLKNLFKKMETTVGDGCKPH